MSTSVIDLEEYKAQRIVEFESRAARGPGFTIDAVEDAKVKLRRAADMIGELIAQVPEVIQGE